MLDPRFNPRLTASPQSVQRFALATLFFATNGTTWQGSDKWVTEAPTCDWFTSGASRNRCNIQDDNAGMFAELDLNRNNLRGTIPPELALLSDHLVSLDLTFNQLTGTIPSELGLLTNLEVVVVSANALTGTIPTELGQLRVVNELYLDANDLTGSMPNEVCTLRNSTLRLLWGDCAEVTCDCCGRCCTDNEPCNEF